MAGDIFVSLAYRSVRLHLLRSLLAALGIVIGVVAITTMGIMGVNMSLSVTAQLSSSGNVITISPYTGGGRGFGGGGDSSANLNITESQLQDIKRVAGANQVIPIHSTSDKITVGSKEGRASILGLDPSTVSRSLVVTEGNSLKGGDGALVGPTLAGDFSLNVGTRIKLGSDSNSTKTVRVVGILEETGFGSSLSTDSAIVVTDKWYTAAYGGQGEYSSVNIIVDDINQIGTIENNTNKALNRNQKLPAVRISDSGSFLSTITSTLGTITTFITALGAISLVVAAVSIFNVTIMSVSERIKEIGILRSIGTRKSEIRKMFVYESFIIGGIGATIGALVSIVSGYLAVLVMIGNATYFFESASIIYIPYGMFIGIGTCLVSGLYPAWRAADLDPIEALRAE